MRCRRFVISALLVLASSALIASSGLAQPRGSGPIAVAHSVFDPATGQETTDVMTMNGDGSNPQVLTHSAPGGFSGDPRFRPDGQIFFDSDGSGNVHLFVMGADGSDLTQLTSGDGFEFTPDPSENGHLFVYEHDNADFTDGGIYVAKKHGDARRLTTAPGLATGGFDGYPVFSREGNRVAFLRVLSTERATASAAIFTIGADGHDLRQITPSSMDPGPPHWSPDGRRLVFADHADDGTADVPQSLWAVNADGSGLRQIIQTPLHNQYNQPEWSADGRSIVFVHFSIGLGFFTQLEVIGVDGTGQHSIWHGADFTFDERPAVAAGGQG
jgi:Tol biopolymer transport system component